MTLKAKVLIVVILLLVLLFIVNMVRKRELELKYVLAWLLCDITLICLTCFPKLMDKLASFFGIKSAVNMIFFFGFLFSLIIIFALTVTLSRVTAKVRIITQKMALQMEQMENNLDNE